jgi:hypothetical protein
MREGVAIIFPGLILLTAIDAVRQANFKPQLLNGRQFFKPEEPLRRLTEEYPQLVIA